MLIRSVNLNGTYRSVSHNVHLYKRQFIVRIVLNHIAV